MDISYLYQPVYLIVVAILTSFTMNHYRSIKLYPHHNIGLNKYGLAITITIVLVLVIGNRPTRSEVFGDTVNYTSWYSMYDKGDSFVWDWNSENFIFDNFYSLFASNHIPIEFFFLFISLIYFGGIFIACKKMFPNDTTLALLVYLAAFSTFSYGTNGIKAGAAAAIFLLALAYRKKKVIAILLLWVSLGFHHSMLAPIASFFGAYFYRNPKVYLWAWIVCLLLAAAHVTFFMSLFSGYTDEHGASYLVADNVTKDVSGFRPDFILYSAIPIYIGYHLINKRPIISEMYNFLWCTYTMTNCVFLLCTYGSYINRIAYLSWLMYPFVLIYPFLHFQWNPNQNRYLRYTVYGHLGFTLFMSFVYYGI